MQYFLCFVSNLITIPYCCITLYHSKSQNITLCLFPLPTTLQSDVEISGFFLRVSTRCSPHCEHRRSSSAYAFTLALAAVKFGDVRFSVYANRAKIHWKVAEVRHSQLIWWSIPLSANRNLSDIGPRSCPISRVSGARSKGCVAVTSSYAKHACGVRQMFEKGSTERPEPWTVERFVSLQSDATKHGIVEAAV